MHSKELKKPDGRNLTLYSNQAIPDGLVAPSPFPDPQLANPHLRWHPLRGEWVTYAAFRQNRTYQPPPQYNPLAPTSDPQHPTEMPAGDYEIAVFDNRFPSLALESHDPPTLTVPTAPANGHCEVVVFTQDPSAALAHLPLSRIELLLQVWGDRTTRIGSQPHIHYVLPFENRGAEVGVTLHHPHGQIYSYPFVPAVPARMLAQEREYYLQHGSSLLCDMARDEAADGKRVLYQDDYAIAFVPACARYPYEVWVMPTAPCKDFAALTPPQRESLARALKTVLLKFETLWNRPFPYLMAWYQAPTDGAEHPETQLHAQFYPPYRTKDRLKYLAGTELAAGMFAMDVLPETTAYELQQVEVSLEEIGMMAGSERVDEVAGKLALLRETLAQAGAGALRLRGADWFAWVTAGGSNAVLHTTDTGVAEVLVTPHEACILTDQIEGERLRTEEVPEGFTFHIEPWAEPELRERYVAGVAAGLPVLSDRPANGEQALPLALRQRRLVLGAAEQDRYRRAGP